MIKIRFKYTPTQADRETLYLSGFRYEKHHHTWCGPDTDYNALLAEMFKEDGNVTVTLLGDM